jgi:hypothetical protein
MSLDFNGVTTVFANISGLSGSKKFVVAPSGNSFTAGDIFIPNGQAGASI